MDIYKAQEANKIFAFDRTEPQRSLARLLKAYAEKLEAYDALDYVFEIGQPQVTLRLGSHEVTFRMPEGSDLYDTSRTQFAEELRQLEQSIVLAHIAIQDEPDSTDNSPGAYVPKIAALCQPCSCHLTAKATL